MLSQEEKEKVAKFEKDVQVASADRKELQSQVSTGEEELVRVKQNAEETESALRQTVEQLHEVLVGSRPTRWRHFQWLRC